MSIDTGWSAASLQAPVHAQMRRLNNATRLIGSRMQNRVLAGQAPAPKPVVNSLRSPLERSILSMGSSAPVIKPVLNTDGASVLNPEPVKPQPGTNVIPTPVKVTQPGIDTNIATAIPTANDEGIPKMTSLSGWMTPGANLTR